MKSCSSNTGKKIPLFASGWEGILGYLYSAAELRHFLQLGLRDNQHSFLLKPGLQNRPVSAGSPPTPSALGPPSLQPPAPPPSPGHHHCHLAWLQFPRRQGVHLKAERPKYLGSEMKARIMTCWQIDLPRTGLWNVHRTWHKGPFRALGKGPMPRTLLPSPRICSREKNGVPGRTNSKLLPLYVLAGK